jgi:ABC-type polysaccharide/polyol phosphate transport system ATPase subunit
MDTMSIQDPVVQVSGLRMTYRGGFEALRGIDFEIERGETFALLGRTARARARPSKSSRDIATRLLARLEYPARTR